MIRPFKITYYSSNYHEPTSVYIIKNHRGEYIGKGEKSFDFKKLLSYPITAFGYDVQNMPDINPRFSKHDTIRALDFWIEHWVYHNQVESVLTGTVNVDHEITLKELILVREKIMKMSVDTKFTRERIKEPVLDYSKGGHNFNFEAYKNGVRKFYHYDGDDDRVITNMDILEVKEAEIFNKKTFPKKGHYKKPKLPKKIVFTEAVFVEDSSLDPFCHKVVEMTREEYEKTIKKIPEAAGLMSRDIAQNLLGISGDFSAIIDNLTRRMINQAPVPSEPQLQIGDIVVWDRESNRFRRTILGDDPLERIRLSTETQSPEFLRWVTTGTFVIPEDTHLIAGNMLDIRNGFRDIVVAHGTVAERLGPRDTIALDENGQWRKVPPIRFGSITTTGADFPVALPTTEVRGWNLLGNINPNSWVVVTNPQGGFKIINSVDNSNVATDFTTREAAQAFLDNVRERLLSSEVRSVGTGPDHLLFSNLHPGIPKDEEDN